MAKKQDTTDSPKSGGDKPRQVVFVTLDNETWNALETYRADQDVAPERAAITLKALRQFLTERKYLKPSR